MLRGLRRNKGSGAAASSAPSTAYEELSDELREFLRPADSSAVTRGLQSWDWVDLAGRKPLLVSLFGHVICSGDDGLWVVDPIDGSFERRWSSLDEATAELSGEEGQDEHLLAGLAMGAQRRGLELADGQVWQLVPPPALGGQFDIDNLQAAELAVVLDIAGQLHAQLRNRPPEAEITEFALDD